jgi:hypothetical protein
MPNDRDALSSAAAEDVADALAFAQRFQGPPARPQRRRAHVGDLAKRASSISRARPLSS